MLRGVMKQACFIFLAVLLALSACTSGDAPDQPAEPDTFEGQSKDDFPAENERENANLNFDREQAQETAERLARLATRIDEVNDATAVVIGPWAVVGIDIDAHHDRGRVGNVKYSVAEALKEDPAGAYAVVTADPDIMQRLREMREAISSGDPVGGFMDELAEIVGRLMPQVPRDVEAPRTPADQEENVDEAKRSPDINRLEER